MSSFLNSARNVYIDGSLLNAECRRKDGTTWVKSQPLDLDRIIGNIDGHFQWDGVNFTQSARNIRLANDELNLLIADLRERDQDFNNDQSIDLGSRIMNIDGQLTYQK